MHGSKACRLALAVLCLLIFYEYGIHPDEANCAKIMVVAPHPDDDVLIAAGITYGALNRGDEVRIIYMTNGDLFNGPSEGLVREGEAVSGQSYLGDNENNLIFLGYPDGYLDSIHLYYTDSGDRLTTGFGQSETYGNRGLGRQDYHSYRFGSPAAYNRYNLIMDLSDIMDSFRPDHVFTSHPYDEHADHVHTYALVKMAAEEVINGNPSYNPTLHIGYVHAGDWPNVLNTTTYFSIVPGVATSTWNARESLDVPLPLQSTNLLENPKYMAIASHASQGGASGWLGSFVHKDEVFWQEALTGTNNPPRVEAGPGQSVSGGASVALDGSGSSDPDNDTLTYSWVQRGGTTVTLSGANTVHPSFTAPSNDVLTFELRVSDGTFTSPPDLVEIVAGSGGRQPPGSENIAPLAAVTASSQTTQYSQLATKAVDGTAEGWPGDYTKEWATLGEKANAWIKLAWSSSYDVNKIVLYDRPNSDDRVLGGAITFSDDSTLAIGALPNDGTASQYTLATKSITSLTFRITSVSSSTLNIGLAEIEVYGTPTPANKPPVAEAGPNQTVNEGVLVHLDGSASSDPDKDPLTYAWTQAAGILVPLTGATTATPSFTAPSGLTKDELLTFQLKVNDGLVSATDTVSITVRMNRGPVAEAGPNQTVLENVIVNLDGSASSDPDGSTLAFAWTQTTGLNVQLAGADTSKPSFTSPLGITKDEILVFQLTVSDGKLAASDTVTITVRKNTGPIAEAGPNQTVLENVLVKLDGTASSDPDGNPLTFSWLQTAGPTVQFTGANTATPTFTSPSGLTSDQTLTFQLTVSDGRTSSVDSVNILVRMNRGPLAEAGPNQTVLENVLVHLDGTLSADPDGNPLTFSWAQTAGLNVQLSGATTSTPSFTAPAGILHDELLTFRLTVSDGRLSNSDTVDITVKMNNLAPIAEAGPNQNVQEGVVVQLDGGKSSDPDGNPITYAWVQTAGIPVTLSGPTTVNPTFTSPTGITKNETLTFQLTVTDSRGGSSSDSVTITVSINRLPIAEAGPSQTVIENVLVQLDGTASSDPDGNPLAFAWIQTSGIAVTLSGAGTAKPTFTSPAGLTQNAVLVFQLTVSDDKGGSSSDTVTITVQMNRAPAAEAGPNQTVNEGVLVHLDGTASSDPDGNALSYAWTQTAGISVALSGANTATPSFTSPSGISQNETLTFRLTVSDGKLTGADTVNVVVQQSLTYVNIAPLATVTASSQTTSTGQLAIKAVDGSTSGWPGDYTKEWATQGQKAGAWLKLLWSRTYSVNKITFYDRPNTDDQVTGGTVSFSDGSTLTVGPLNNNGSATSYSFTPKTITSLTLTIATVKNSTLNIGLAEIKVFGATVGGTLGAGETLETLTAQEGFSTDSGDSVSTAGGDSALTALSLESGATGSASALQIPAAQDTFSPAQQILYVSGAAEGQPAGIWEIDLATGRDILERRLADFTPQGITVTGDTILLGGSQGALAPEVRLYDPQTNSTTGLFQPAAGRLLSIAAGSGVTYVAEVVDGETRIYSYSNTNELIRVTGIPADVQAITWGKESLYAAAPHKIYQTNPATGAVLATIAIPLESPQGIAYLDGAVPGFIISSGDMLYRLDLDRNMQPASFTQQLRMPQGYRYAIVAISK